jgi:CrcB protein
VTRTALIALGGLTGSVARYWLAGLVQRAAGSSFPAGTLTVNVLGSLVIGVVMALALERGMMGENTRLLLTTGFCGGFTTMSTFSYETLALLEAGQAASALANVAASVVACVGATWVGQLLVRAVV